MRKKQQVDEQAEARINEMYARESEKIQKQQKSKTKPGTVKRAANRKTTGNRRAGRKN